MARPKASGRVLTVRVSPVVDARLQEQADLFGMPIHQYASMVLAQQSLAVQQVSLALPGAIAQAAQAAFKDAEEGSA
jgi:hypothetical protein